MYILSLALAIAVQDRSPCEQNLANYLQKLEASRIQTAASAVIARRLPHLESSDKSLLAIVDRKSFDAAYEAKVDQFEAEWLEKLDSRIEIDLTIEEGPFYLGQREGEKAVQKVKVMGTWKVFRPLLSLEETFLAGAIPGKLRRNFAATKINDRLETRVTGSAHWVRIGNYRGLLTRYVETEAEESKKANWQGDYYKRPENAESINEVKLIEFLVGNIDPKPGNFLISAQNARLKGIDHDIAFQCGIPKHCALMPLGSELPQYLSPSMIKKLQELTHEDLKALLKDDLTDEEIYFVNLRREILLEVFQK